MRKTISTPNRISFSAENDITSDDFRFTSFSSRASAPTSRRVPSSSTNSRHSLSASRSISVEESDGKDIRVLAATSVAVAAESNSALLPKRSFSLPSKSKLSKVSNETSPPSRKSSDSYTHNSRDAPPEFSRPPSRANVSNRASIELNVAKKKVIPPRSEEYSSPSPNYRVNQQNQPSAPSPVSRFDDRFQHQSPVPPPAEPSEYKKVPAPNYHENDEDENLDVSDYLIPCDYCGRKFMEDRLVRR
jgi:hypothetical protein